MTMWFPNKKEFTTPETSYPKSKQRSLEVNFKDKTKSGTSSILLTYTFRF